MGFRGSFPLGGSYIVMRITARPRQRAYAWASAAAVVLVGGLAFGTPVLAHEDATPRPTATVALAATPDPTVDPYAEPGPTSEPGRAACQPGDLPTASSPSSPTSGPSASPGPGVEPTVAPSDDPTPLPTPGDAPTSTTAPDPGPAPTPSATPTASAAPTASAQPTSTPPGETPAPSPTPSASPTRWPTPVPDATASPSPSVRVIDASGEPVLEAIVDVAACTRQPDLDGPRCLTASAALDDDAAQSRVLSLVAQAHSIAGDVDVWLSVQVRMSCAAEDGSATQRTYRTTFEPGDGSTWPDLDATGGVLTLMVAGCRTATVDVPDTTPAPGHATAAAVHSEAPAITGTTGGTVPRAVGTAPARSGRGGGATIANDQTAPQTDDITELPAVPADQTPAVPAEAPTPATPDLQPALENPPAPQRSSTLDDFAGSPLAPLLGGAVVIAGLLLAFAPPIGRPSSR